MSTITFKSKVFFTFLMLLFSSLGWAQYHSCIVYDALSLSERNALGISNKKLLNHKKIISEENLIIPNNYTITPKKFRINFWRVTNDNNSNGINLSYSLALKYVERLNRIYQPYQICFVLNGNGILKSTSHMNGKDHIDLRNEGIKKNAYVDNSINVYIAESIIGGADGATELFSNSIAIKEHPMSTSEVLLAHEIGHVLSLYHTHGYHNRPPNGNVGSVLPCEHVTRNTNDPNYNALQQGDRVHDTAADPGLDSRSYLSTYNIDSNCNYIGNLTDCQGNTYLVDSSIINNIMSYAPEACQTLLTPGQVQRIHYNMDNANPLAYVKRAMILDTDLSYDLMLRNTTNDSGEEPDLISQTFWDSPDIWVRHTNNNSLKHQNPIYGIGNNYVKVRIVNKGCARSNGNGKLKLYWTKAGTNLPMQVWNGSILLNGVPAGGLIGEFNLPVLDSHEEYIFTFPWAVPNPARYSDNEEPWHFCLLAKIETPDDVSSLPEDNGVYYNILNSNNLALKNVSVINTTETNSGKIHVNNFNGINRNIKLKLSQINSYQTHSNIFKDAEVKFVFDDKLWEVWKRSDFKGSNFREFGDKTIIVKENTEIVFNDFPKDYFGLLNVKVNFLTDAYSENTEFEFNVEHWNIDTKELVGGELFLIEKNERNLFNVDAEIVDNIIKAIPINEPAVYNWYNADGKLLHKGETFYVKNSNTTYLLEVIADYDGFKKTKEISLNKANALIHSIYPNPATNSVTVQYNKLNCSNAYLMVVNINSKTIENYILNINSNEIKIDTSQFILGLYRIVLVCDNNVIESHNLIIQ